MSAIALLNTSTLMKTISSKRGLSGYFGERHRWNMCQENKRRRVNVLEGTPPQRVRSFSTSGIGYLISLNGSGTSSGQCSGPSPNSSLY